MYILWVHIHLLLIFYMHSCAPYSCSPCCGQKRVLDALGRELQMVVSCLVGAENQVWKWTIIDLGFWRASWVKGETSLTEWHTVTAGVVRTEAERALLLMVTAPASVRTCPDGSVGAQEPVPMASEAFKFAPTLIACCSRPNLYLELWQTDATNHSLVSSMVTLEALGAQKPSLVFFPSVFCIVVMGIPNLPLNHSGLT